LRRAGAAVPRWVGGTVNRRLQQSNHGATLVIVVALTSIAAGCGLIALDLATGSSTLAAGGGVHHRARPVVPITVAPTTTTTAAPPVSTTIAVRPAESTADVTGDITAPVVNGVPSTITDPSEIASSHVPSLPLYASPAAASPTSSLPLHNYLGAPLVLLVTAVQGNWVQAYVPQRPNESTAWVLLADVTLSTVPCHIVISISAHELTLYCDNAVAFQTTVATGAPDSPTPTGSFFVAYMVKLTDPEDAYGPYALGTSAFSNTYFSFEGGPGQIGIHGTNQPWVIGSYASHGCVRLTNTAITTLAEKVVPGTPVEIGP
jgi:lipoprotein-anchoring transpeptidase ErfK/SrfK